MQQKHKGKIGLESRSFKKKGYGRRKKMEKWWIVEIADGNDGFISVFAETAEEAEMTALDEGYEVLYAHTEDEE